MALPCARHTARCFLSSPAPLSFLQPSDAGTLAAESLPTLPGGDAHAARSDRLRPPFPWPSEAFSAAIDVARTAVLLVPLPAVGARAACAAAFFGPLGGTNLGILEDGGPPGETGWAPVPDG